MNYTGGESLSTGTAMQSSAHACLEAQDDEACIVAAIRRGTDTHLQQQLYVKYRRPLLQILQHRGISFDLAQDLVQRTFLIALKKIHSEGLEDPGNLGGYLYRTACNLAARHWRGTLAHPYEHDSEETLGNLPDEALSLEERLDHEILARSVRSLMQRLHHPRDREVLQRYYLLEEPKEAICESLRLTELQFNQVLFRARQRFGDILRRNGYARTMWFAGILAVGLTAGWYGRFLTEPRLAADDAQLAFFNLPPTIRGSECVPLRLGTEALTVVVRIPGLAPDAEVLVQNLAGKALRADHYGARRQADGSWLLRLSAQDLRTRPIQLQVRTAHGGSEPLGCLSVP